MNLFLDDVRDCPDDFLHAQSVNDAIKIMQLIPIEFASLDHDLGDFEPHGGDGIKLIDWMVEEDIWPSQGIKIHSANPVGVKNMLLTIENYGPYPVSYGNIRGNWF